MKARVDYSKASARIAKLIKTLKDLEPVLSDIADKIIQEFEANFDAEGGVLNKPWAARTKDYPWPLLQKTGALKAGFKKETKKNVLKITNAVEYAKYIHFGTPKMTARSLVGLNPNILKLAKDRILKYIKERALN